MNIILTTLSLGENYTKDYTLRMIEDVLKMSNIDIYITTDCKNIIDQKYKNNNRIKIQEINRSDLKIRLPIGEQKAASDFNFNMRYLCLEHVQDIENTLIIFTDCDNSFDWWDENTILDEVNKNLNNGFDFYGPRTDLKFKLVLDKFNNQCLSYIETREPNFDDCTIFWHKLFNYDLIDTNNKLIKDYPNHPWSMAPLPAEYLLVFYNTNGKLKKMVTQWKSFHDYLVNKDWTYGTWAEGFEIGVSALVADFKPLDISFTHPIWNRVFTPNGYKTGPRGGIVHGTEH